MSTLILFANNATSTLAEPITASATTATLAAGTGALFPNPTSGEYFVLTFLDAATQTIREIVWVTGISGDTITAMTRGQEGTTPTAYLAGDYAQSLITAGSLQKISNVTQGITPLPVVGYEFASLPAASGYAVGTQAFCENGRNTGETAGNGTGTPVFVKSVSGTNVWCAIWSGVAVTV